MTECAGFRPFEGALLIRRTGAAAVCISAISKNFDKAFGKARELYSIKMPTRARGIVTIRAGHRYACSSL